MTKQTVSISNAHDGMPLEVREANTIARLVEFHLCATHEQWARYQEIANILRGKRRDGSEPEDAA